MKDVSDKELESLMQLMKKKEGYKVGTMKEKPTRITSDQEKALSQMIDDARMDRDIKYFGEVRDAYQRVATAGGTAETDKTGVGDLTLLRGYAKLTDPTTGVKEEEYRTMQGAQGALSKLGIYLTEGMISGKQLTASARQEFLNKSKELYKAHEAMYNQKVEYWKNVASARNVPFELVLADIRAGESQIGETKEFTGTTREDATKFLQDNGQKVTDANIDYLLNLK
jgi:hypothetical protein